MTVTLYLRGGKSMLLCKGVRLPCSEVNFVEPTKPRMVQTSAVVVAQEHNPSILHPSFLQAQSIVPSDWELADAPLTTPAFARVAYQNGVQIVIDNARLQVIDSLAHSVEQSPVFRIAQLYIEELPHVRYTGVGINFTCLFEQADPGLKILAKFVSEGRWKDEELSPVGVNLQFSYRQDAVQLNVSIGPGAVQFAGEQGQRVGISVGGNYHTNLEQGDQVRHARRALGKAMQQFGHFQGLLSKFFGEEDVEDVG